MQNMGLYISLYITFIYLFLKAKQNENMKCTVWLLLEVATVVLVEWGYARLIHESTLPCSESLPLHAQRLNYTNQSCTWRCREGYYQTSSALEPTCRQCAKPSFKCPTGSYLENCTDSANFACKACPPIPFLEEYEEGAGDCRNTRCKAGFTWNENLSTCVMCPLNKYCPRGSRKGELPSQCAENCASLAGATSPLDCKIKKTEEPSSLISVYSLNFIIYVPSSSLKLVRVPKICYDIDNILYTSLNYGYFFKCLFKGTPVPVIFQTSCYVGLVNCSNLDAYEHFLGAKLASLRTQLQTTILKCIAGSYLNEIKINVPYILLDKTVSNAELANETFENTNAGYFDRPVDSPEVSDGKIEWFSDLGQLMDAFRFFYIVILILVLCILFLCAICYMQLKRGRNIKEAYKSLEKEHKLNLGKV